MSLTDNEYLSILDLEISKAKRDLGNFVIYVSNKTLLILEDSPNLILVNEKGKVEYFYRGIYKVIVDKELDNDTDKDFYFKEVKR